MDDSGTAQPPTGGNGRLALGGEQDQLAWSLRSDPGGVRDHNEDFGGTFLPEPGPAAARGPLFVVADGMGGHAAGEVASRVAVEAALATWQEQEGQPAQPALRSALRAANTAVFDTAIEQRTHGMGTTIVAATLTGREVVTAHVGDSRAYLVHGDRCVQLTTDHSRVAEMLRMKLITPEQAAVHPARSMLTRSLGNELSVQVDFNTYPVNRGDVLMLCSDGLWDLVSRTELVDVVRSNQGASPRQAADQLLAAALERGAPDNVTTLVVRVEGNAPFPAASGRRSLFGRRRP